MKLGHHSKRPRLKEGAHTSLENAIFQWLLKVGNKDVAVSALILKNKAKEFAEKLNVKNFKASDGWLDRWKTRHNVTFKAVSGEEDACTSSMTAPWKETTLPTILSKYKLDQIYNADEFGLFYRAQQGKALNLKTERCAGGKHSKIRLNGLAAVNAVGKKSRRCLSLGNQNLLGVLKV